MSELKAISSGEIYKIIEYEDCYRTDDLYYPKSEADKVIVHHKYKRCLDMVAHCDLKMSYWAIREIHEGDTGKFELYSKWHERWLQLAEKFKEAK